MESGRTGESGGMLDHMGGNLSLGGPLANLGAGGEECDKFHRLLLVPAHTFSL